MRVPNFIYGSNESQSPLADVEQTINWYFEPPQSPGGRPSLLPTPGVNSIATGASNPGRAHFFENDREFAVIGTIFYEIDSTGTLTNRGTVALDDNPATISSNGDGGGQLFITSGGNGYYFTLSTNTLTQITALNGLATMGDYLDGYFLALDSNTSTLYISALLDGSSWTTGTDFAQRNVGSDPWVAMRVHRRFIWLIGEETSEVWYNAGGSFPLAFHPSGLIPYGTSAPWSLAVSDEVLCGLGRSKHGEGQILRTQGFTPEIVSTAAVQNEINGYDVISDARGWTYTDLGHSFYILNFPNDQKTWALDIPLGLNGWAKRGTWISESGTYNLWRPIWYVRAFGENRVLDADSGDIYQMGAEYFTDVDSREIRRLRRAPALNDELRRVFYSCFELDLEPGLGAVTGQGSNPQVMMRFSDDGGKTWSAERWVSAGALGQYSKRARWFRLGSGRRRVWEVTVSDPVAWRVLDAYIQAEEGAA